MPEAQWPAQHPNDPQVITAVWRSRDFLVLVYTDPHCVARLSMCRADLNDAGMWRDGLTWEQMQRLKSEAGFGSFDAVEVFPPEADVINVANFRHLWVMATPLPFAWRAQQGPVASGRSVVAIGGE